MSDKPLGDRNIAKARDFMLLLESPMLDETTLERRLMTLEQAVSDLQRKIDSKSTPENWLQKLIGSISDEAAFLKALEYGQTFRQADKPTDEGGEQS